MAQGAIGLRRFGRIAFFPLLLGVLLQGCSLFSDSPASNYTALPAAFNSPSSSESSMKAEEPQTDAERVAEARKTHGDYYANRLALFLKETPDCPKGGIVFLGDSITERLPIGEAFPEENVINRGIGGDHIEGVIDRLDVSVAELEPVRVYLLIGINDLIWVKSKTVEDFARSYDRLLTELVHAAPQAEIVCESVLPVRGQWAGYNEKVDQFNALIEPLVEKHGLEYVDLHPWMADRNGDMVSEYTVDGIHLSLEGNVAWLECLLPQDEFLDATLNLAPYRAEARTTSFPVAAVNPTVEGEFPGGRGPDQLIVYTPAHGKETTGTNEWGYEVTVENGIVTKTGGNDSAIPADGFVVSGHGKASGWMRANLVAGAKVSYDAKSVRFTPAPEEGLSTGRRLRALRFHVLDVLPALAAAGRDSAGFREGTALLEEIHGYQARRPGVDPAVVDALAMRVKRLDWRLPD